MQHLHHLASEVHQTPDTRSAILNLIYRIKSMNGFETLILFHNKELKQIPKNQHTFVNDNYT